MRLISVSLALLMLLMAQELRAQGAPITHGPVLGRVSSEGISVWARTEQSGEFQVRYGTDPNHLNQLSSPRHTELSNDNTGVVQLKGLEPATRYHYRLIAGGHDTDRGGSFTTLQDSAKLIDPKLNPKGLFNFSFEFACGNNQHPTGGLGPTMPTYSTMLQQIKGKVDFSVQNGDWIYEDSRDYKLAEWQKQVGIKPSQTPENLRLVPTTVAMWQNYKNYLGRSESLAQWVRNTPTFFTYDDHEIINDAYGAGEIGRVDRRAVFRDIGLKAWYDYVAWSNPTVHSQGILFGRGEFKKGSDVLVDPQADFTKLDMNQIANLHVHWGGPNEAKQGLEFSDKEGGNPNAGVYEVVKVIDKHRVQIRPTARADGTTAYSIGRRSYGKFRVANCDFYLLDTRTHRMMHNVYDPNKKGVSMLGKQQLAWLKKEMKNSDAEFFFVFSSVNLMIPHAGGGGAKIQTSNKDDAWTVFVEEREELINFWDSLNKPVCVLTGDLHNSFAIKVTDRVWEFASGPHNSVNHRLSDEGDRPITGRYKFGPRACEIRWSTSMQGDIPRSQRHMPSYCVVQVNNVFNNPLEKGDTRWIAFPQPQVIFKYYNGLTGELRYAETISMTGQAPIVEKKWEEQPTGTDLN
ncbi:MAG: alkaline phosphatase D family protein [Pirellulales bacterium]